MNIWVKNVQNFEIFQKREGYCMRLLQVTNKKRKQARKGPGGHRGGCP